MPVRIRLLLAFLLVALGLSAEARAEDDYDEEIVVYSDLFARWDDTRWFVKTEVGMPYPITFHAQNKEFRTGTFQMRAILFCSKQRRRGLRHYMVDCEIEDFGMVAVALELVPPTPPETIQEVLDTIDGHLTGARFQLRVSEDGQIKSVELEGIDTRRREENLWVETMSTVMSRLILGFDMKLRKWNDLSEGQWVEYNPELMSIPVPGDIRTRGSSMLIHQLQPFRGETVVQTAGRGMITFGEASGESNFDAQFDGVSIYDRKDGYMTERVWALAGRSTAGSGISEAGTAFYWHAGRISWLGEKGTADVGPTHQVAAPIPPDEVERRQLVIKLRRKNKKEERRPEDEDQSGLPPWPYLE